jgi:hypothetical protein
MSIILPTVEDLVDRAMAATRFAHEIERAPYRLTPSAELAAQLAAEQWEHAHGAPVGQTVPPDLAAAAARALAIRGRAHLIRLGAARLDRAMAALEIVRREMKGMLPVPEAEALMDEVEDRLDIVGVNFTRAAAVLEAVR